MHQGKAAKTTAPPLDAYFRYMGAPSGDSDLRTFSDEQTCCRQPDAAVPCFLWESPDATQPLFLREDGSGNCCPEICEVTTQMKLDITALLESLLQE